MLCFSSNLRICFKSTDAKQFNRIISRNEQVENPSYAGFAGILRRLSVHGRGTFAHTRKGHFSQGKRADFSSARPEKTLYRESTIFPSGLSMNLVFRTTPRRRTDIFTIAVHKGHRSSSVGCKGTFSCAQTSLSPTFAVSHTLLEFILSSLR